MTMSLTNHFQLFNNFLTLFSFKNFVRLSIDLTRIIFYTEKLFVFSVRLLVAEIKSLFFHILARKLPQKRALFTIWYALQLIKLIFCQETYDITQKQAKSINANMKSRTFLWYGRLACALSLRCELEIKTRTITCLWSMPDSRLTVIWILLIRFTDFDNYVNICHMTYLSIIN